MIPRELANKLVKDLERFLQSRSFKNSKNQAYSRSVLIHLHAPEEEWPDYNFSVSHLVDGAHFLLMNAVLVKPFEEHAELAREALKEAAEVLEFLYSNNREKKVEQIRQLTFSALAYYIAGFYARSYVLMKELEIPVESPVEYRALRLLFLKDIKALRSLIYSELKRINLSDKGLKEKWNSENADPDQIIWEVAQETYLRALSYYVEYVKCGEKSLLDKVINFLDIGIHLAHQYQFVDWWWVFYFARYLIMEYWDHSLWNNLNSLLVQENGDIVRKYIVYQYKSIPSVVELWPSQKSAVPHIFEPERRDYVLRMPTSAGKTRIAEITILQFLLDEPIKLCLYIAPFRSLAAEVEKGLKKIFHPLGFGVTELYGGFEFGQYERMIVEESRIVVATPEKIDAFLRYNADLIDQIGLVIVDEGHIVSFSHRGLKYEMFLQRLKRLLQHNLPRYLFISAVLPNTDEFSEWLCGSSEQIITSNWRPARFLTAELEWRSNGGRLEYLDNRPCFVPHFITPRNIRHVNPRRRNLYPHDSREAIVEAAVKFALEGSTMIFTAQKRSVKPLGEQILKTLEIWKKEHPGFQFPLARGKEALYKDALKATVEFLGENHLVTECLKERVILHHGDLPQPLRVKFENLARNEVVRLIIATTTLAQGVNLPIRTILIHSLQQDYGQYVSSINFWNICGRAGRGMKENEGHVIFFVDLTKPRKVIIKEKQRREELLRGMEKAFIVSALLQVLAYIRDQWKKVYGKVDFDALSEALANQNFSWLPDEEVDTFHGWLNVLDSQLLALTAESDVQEVTPDQLQELLSHSLLHIQLRRLAKNPEKAWEQCTHMLAARTQYIYKVADSETKRKKYYKLGFSPRDCQVMEQHEDELYDLFFQAGNTMDLDINKLLVEIATILFELNDLKPKKEYVSWEEIMNQWLEGYSVKDIANHPEIGNEIDDLYALTNYIEDVFGYKLPWGVNATWVYLNEIAEERGEELPPLTSFFTPMIRYGINHPVACVLMTCGVENRRLAKALALHYTGGPYDYKAISQWFRYLFVQDFESFGFDEDEILELLGYQKAFGFQKEDPDREEFTLTVDKNEIYQPIEENMRYVLEAKEKDNPNMVDLYTIDRKLVISDVELTDDLVAFLASEDSWLDLSVKEITDEDEELTIHFSVEKM